MASAKLFFGECPNPVSNQLGLPRPCNPVTITKPIDEQIVICPPSGLTPGTNSVKITFGDVVVTGPAIAKVTFVVVRTVTIGECAALRTTYRLTFDDNPIGPEFVADTGLPAGISLPMVVGFFSFPVPPGPHRIGLQVTHPCSPCSENISNGAIEVDAQCVGNMQFQPTLS